MNFEKLKAIHQTFATHMSQIFRQISGKNAQLFLRKRNKKKSSFYALLNSLEQIHTEALKPAAEHET